MGRLLRYCRQARIAPSEFREGIRYVNASVMAVVRGDAEVHAALLRVGEDRGAYRELSGVVERRAIEFALDLLDLVSAAPVPSHR